MPLEALLAGLHIVAILSLVVFLSSEAALCRAEWMNAAVVRRLARLDAIYGITAVAVLLTGLARAYWGLKGGAWYWSQPLLHAKLGLFVLIGLLSIQPTLRFRRWLRALEASGALPAEAEIRSTRARILLQAHLLVLIPIAAVMLARGVGTR
jgi:putative membrane protein